MKKHLAPHFKERSFGVSVGGVMILVSAYLIWRGRVPAAGAVAAVGALLIVLGLTEPRLLKWPSAVWWKFAMVLGYVNARVILTLAFLIVLAPIGLLWRAIGNDPLARQRRNWTGWSPSPERYRKPDHFTRMY